MRIKKLLIANRGEIAVRIIRAAQELGIKTVIVHSTADAESLAVKMADEAVEIGPGPAVKSYLCQELILNAAKSTGADAVHPGYGFLAENAAFARAVIDAGMIFIGPSPETIERMGDKVQARATAQAAGVPVVPGSEGIVQEVSQALAIAEKIGYPLMIKAAAGGGGKGIRIVETPNEFEAAFQAAQREGQSAFGDGSLYLEKFIKRARHIEVQILGDGLRAVHCFERECSLQRRRQKVFEEAPSPALNEQTRQELCTSAVKLAEAVNYCGAGTLEYLYDDEAKQFYFIEMNTRIQVEHPITEMVTGVDLVREMILVAAGQPLSLHQEQITLRGAAIECRINAEDPFNQFFPNIGKIEYLQWPSGPGVRIDSMLYQGYAIAPFYDSMLAKLIVWDQDRKTALCRLQRALTETKIEGLKTTLSLHEALVKDAEVHSANFHTNWLEDWLDKQYPKDKKS